MTTCVGSLTVIVQLLTQLKRPLTEQSAPVHDANHQHLECMEVSPEHDVHG